MLPKSRIFSALLVGLGVALMVAGFAAPRFLLGDGRLPLDLENTTYTLYDENGSVEGEPEPVTRQLHMDVQNPANDDMASLRVGETLFRGAEGEQLDDLITAQTWAWEVDRRTGEALTPATLSSVMVMPTTEVPMDGPWLKLPVNNEEAEIAVFDPMLRAASLAVLEGSEDVDGRTVDTYRQEIPATNLARSYASMIGTRTVSDEEGNQSTTYLTYETNRTLHVDHVTGIVVGIEEDTDLFYADAAGQRAEDFVSYNAATQDDAAKLDQLRGIVSQETSRLVTIIVIAIGAIIALIGLIGALRPEGTRKKKTSAAK